MGVNQAPVFPPSGPLLGDIHGGQIHHFVKTVIRWEYDFSFRYFSELPVESLSGIGCINEGSNFLGIFEIGGEFRPVVSPGIRNFRIFFALFSSNVANSLKAASSVGAV